MNTIDLNQNNIPLTSTLLAYMQSAYKMLELMGQMFGSKLVLTGCTEVVGACDAGVVLIDGEIMPFDGGPLSTYVRVQTTPLTVTVQDGSYTKTEKKLIFGTGTGSFLYADLKRIPTLESVSAQISNKVDVVAGKGLSTNDFTAALLTKLNGIAENANNYIHPIGHNIGDLNFNALEVVSAGGVSAAGQMMYANGLPCYSIKEATGKYKISHNLNSFNYWVIAHTHAFEGSPIHINTITRRADDFTLTTSDDTSYNDTAFEFIIVKINGLEIGYLI